MKKRYLYAALLGIPGFIVSGIVSFVVFGLTMGVLWIFVFGDNPWPPIVEKVLPVLFGLVFLAIWLACTALGFVIGKKLEAIPGLNKKHILASVGFTGLSILIIALYLLIGNLGPKSDGQVCSDFCRQRGYPASSMPPQNSGQRICSCLDQYGVEILKVPIDKIDLFK